MMRIGVRLDEPTRRLLIQLARLHRVSRSEIEDSATEELNLYDRIKDYIGKFRSGRSDLSQNTGEKFYQIVLEKHAAGKKR